MPFFTASEAPPRPESTKFPVFSQLAGNLAISETSTQRTPPSSGESSTNLKAKSPVLGGEAVILRGQLGCQPSSGSPKKSTAPSFVDTEPSAAREQCVGNSPPHCGSISYVRRSAKRSANIPPAHTRFWKARQRALPVPRQWGRLRSSRHRRQASRGRIPPLGQFDEAGAAG